MIWMIITGLGFSPIKYISSFRALYNSLEQNQSKASKACKVYACKMMFTFMTSQDFKWTKMDEYHWNENFHVKD